MELPVFDGNIKNYDFFMKNAIFVSYLLSFIDLISNMNNNEITQL
jgi:hypothetical protein